MRIFSSDRELKNTKETLKKKDEQIALYIHLLISYALKVKVCWIVILDLNSKQTIVCFEIICLL